MIEEVLSVVDVSEDELLINRSNVFDSVANGEEQSKNSVRGRSRSRSNVSNTSVKSFRSIPSLRSNRSHHSRRSKSSSKSDNDSDNGSDSDSDSDNSNGGEHHVNNHIQYDDILRKANSTEEDYQNSLYHKIASAFGILKSVSFQLFLW